MRAGSVLYSEEIAEKILDLVAEGSNLNQITQMEGMPDRRVVHRWLDRYPEFMAGYKIAKDIRAEGRADSLDELEAEMRAGKIDYNIFRVLMDKVKWQTGKESEKYRDKVQQEITGPGGKPFTVVVSSVLDIQQDDAIEIGKTMGALR